MSQKRAPATTRLKFHPRHARRGTMPPLHAERLYEALGEERTCDEVSRLLRSYVQAEAPPVVGAMRVTCSDEAEQENVEAFQRQFVRYLLPSLKFSSKSPFRVANLGGRYQWGSVRIAEDHYALAQGADHWKMLVVKMSSHVAVIETPTGLEFGKASRYGADSTYCGALDAVLGDSVAPFAQELIEDFQFEGVDRLSALRDPARIPTEVRALFAAATHVRLQARRAMLDIQDYTPRSPTVYLLVPTITLNKAGHDTEIVCGIYTADRRTSEPHDEFCGISSRPWKYELSEESGHLRLTDPEIHTPRHARDHRSVVLNAWAATRSDEPEAADEQVLNVLAHARDAAKSRNLTGSVVKALVCTLAAVAPVPTAVVLFGEGLVHIHHAHRAHQLARAADADQVARAMLAEVGEKIDQLSPEQAHHLVELLSREYAPTGKR